MWKNLNILKYDGNKLYNGGGGDFGAICFGGSVVLAFNVWKNVDVNNGS